MQRNGSAAVVVVVVGGRFGVTPCHCNHLGLFSAAAAAATVRHLSAWHTKVDGEYNYRSFIAGLVVCWHDKMVINQRGGGGV